MCLAIPSKVVEIEGGMAVVEMDGVRRSISLILLNNAKIGDYVIIHAGFAIKILNKNLALKSISLLRKAVNFCKEEKYKKFEKNNEF